ncbi:flagellar biosynthesis protein FlhA [Sphingomonas corticis]|jgi:type III secretion protein V|uniref:FHIPEP family type III secretion protein n=1 Tax=Sphingomonas corticis TaxID=2722791 RepID=A0ABX1CKG5_9SPHN|nr:flagellar biosynthesis protein FlhA [Sphingomonas corticis]NJR78486.1 FHIPEP family type III secretion protein [Sphingomonas corticis]
MSVQNYLATSGQPAKLGFAARFADVALAGFVVTIIGAMILPLPMVLIDLLVAVNITFGVMLLLTTLYVRGPLDFSSFPAILLVSTLFRLALSIATTRMILTEGHGGHIIQTFGSMVAGGNIVVGLVVFLIITIVQFIVIAKGAERVAEVAARFSLDSMPGKQLSIDSDLRSGLIDKDEARRRRRVLELESKLHGSLDGAMKFVKGDAIASIVIVVVNLIGGLAIGVMQQGLDLGAATHKYSILTIGEGLVAQIPALLGAMAAGLMVTRATDEEDSSNLGQTIQRQLSGNPRVLMGVGAVAFLMALIPGFPVAVFIGLGFGAMGTGAMLHPRLRPMLLRRAGPLTALVTRGREAAPPTTLIAEPAAPKPVVPLLLELSGARPGRAEGDALAADLAAMLERLQYRSGVPLPKLAIHFMAPDARPAWQLLAYELPVGHGLREGQAIDAPALVAAVEALLRRNLARFLGVQEAVALLNRIGDDYPEVVKEAVRALPAARIADVMRRLAEEEVPLRNMRDVLEGLTDAAQNERETPRLADMTRIALKRYLIDVAAPDGEVRALVVTPELETMVREATRIVDGAERLAIPPDVAQNLVATIASTARETRANALVTSFEARRAVRKLIEPDLFDLPVLAFNELSSMTRLEMVGQIGLPAGTLANDEAEVSSVVAAE